MNPAQAAVTASRAAERSARGCPCVSAGSGKPRSDLSRCGYRNARNDPRAFGASLAISKASCPLLHRSRTARSSPPRRAQSASLRRRHSSSPMRRPHPWTDSQSSDAPDRPQPLAKHFPSGDPSPNRCRRLQAPPPQPLEASLRTACGEAAQASEPRGSASQSLSISRTRSTNVSLPTSTPRKACENGEAGFCPTPAETN